MRETKTLEETMERLYELITDQLIDPDKLDEPVQRAFDLYRGAIARHDEAVLHIRDFLTCEEGDLAVERLNDCCLDMERLMFMQGYLLGYFRYVPDEEKTQEP